MVLNLFMISCKNNNPSFVRKNIDNNKELFFAIARPEKNDSLDQISRDFINAFNLYPLEDTSVKNEIRIYYVSAWRERFFREIIMGDSATAYLLNCKTDRRSDSLFMTIKTIIEAKGKFEKNILAKLPFLPKAKIWDNKNDPPVLDAGDTYFIEVKNENNVKRMIIDNPFGKALIDIDAKYVSEFIKIITNSNSFQFNDNWKKIDSTAFRKY